MSGQSVIPFLSAREINSLEQYERFHHAKSYIKEKSASIRDNRRQTPELVDLMKKCGYANFTKFREHRQEWDNLVRKVPLVYLCEIGANIEILDQTVRLDQQEFDMALRIPLFPRFAVVRLMACVYQDIEFPIGATEDEAIEILRKFSKEKKLRCCINFPNLKTIWIEPDGKIRYSYYWPSMHVTNYWAFFGSDGREIGTTRLRKQGGFQERGISR